MSYKLIMLTNPIVVSDEISNLDAQEIPHYQTHDRRFYKIIAGIPELPSVDFSALSEEDCKKIGWIDVKKLAEEKYESKGWNEPWYSRILDKQTVFIDGFKTAQSFNKKFTLDDLRKAFEEGIDAQFMLVGLDTYDQREHYRKTRLNSFIQSLSQPKIFDVEVEMELRDAEEVYFELNAKNGDYWNHHFHHYDSGKITIKKEFEHIYSQPKITSNSIKITKVL